MRGFFRFVGLQMSDQVKPGVREIGDGREFALHLLHIVLAEIAQPDSVCVADGLGSEYFGYGQKPDRSGEAARAGACVFHALPDPRQSIGQ